MRARIDGPRAVAAGAVVLAALALVGCLHRGPGAPYVAPSAPPAAPPPLEPTDVLQLTSLSAGDVVTSPLIVTGLARGNWFFEASFPVVLVDGAGHELARTAAHAQGDWTTEAFVPFTATLFFKLPAGATAGALLFQTDNPSGIKEQQRQKRVFVRFVPEQPQ